MLRAGSLRTLRHVVLPLLKPAMVAAPVYSLVRAITTVSAVIFPVTPENEPATTYLIGCLAKSACLGSGDELTFNTAQALVRRCAPIIGA